MKSERKGISDTQQKGDRLTTGHVLRRNCLIKHVIGRKKKRWNRCEDEEIDVISYWIYLQKRGDTGISKNGISSYFKNKVLWTRLMYLSQNGLRYSII